jgi:hypothetical protein
MSSIFPQQAAAEHWDLPTTEIFQCKDVASVFMYEEFLLVNANVAKLG